MEKQSQENLIVQASLLVIASFVLAITLVYTRAVMIPFVVAIFLSYFVKPFVNFYQTKLKFPRSLAILTSLAGGALFLIGLFLIMRDSVLKIINSFYQYQEKLYHLSEVITNFAAKFNIQLNESTILDTIKQLPVFNFLQSAAGSFLMFIANCFLVLTFMIFIVSGQSANVEKEGIYKEIDNKVSRYILTKVTTSFITGIVTWIILTSFGLDLAMMFGVLAFFLNFIPTLGSIIAVLLPLPIAIMQFDSSLTITLAIAIPAVFQLSLGNVLEPKLIGKSLDLHPVTILLSLIFWGLIWGITGAFLAAPITAILKIILERITITHNISEILAGRITRKKATQ